MGYSRAGFEVVGIDDRPQPRYPFRFIQADFFEFVREHGHEYDVIHASPPCQGYSRLRHLPWLAGKTWPRLIPSTRAALEATGRPWIIENVEDARWAMPDAIRLCGLMFDLKCYQHRLFASNLLLFEPQHQRHTVVIGSGKRVNHANEVNEEGFVGVATRVGIDRRRQAIGVEWMTAKETYQAIPPAYTEHLGMQLLWHLEGEAATRRPRKAPVSVAPTTTGGRGGG